MKKITSILLLLITISFSYGQSTLYAGDIAITGLNSDNPDQFSFVLLTDVTSGTTINFTDEGWQSSGSFRGTSEGIVTWTSTSSLSCGTEIIITDTGSNTYSATTGTAIESGLGFSLSDAGDQLLAYQGSSTSPIFLFGIQFGSGAGWSDATDSGTSAVPSGLTDGVNAIDAGNRDNVIYNCSVLSNAALILAAVSNSSNWSGTNAGTRPALTTCGFTSCASTCSSPAVTWTAGAWSPITGPNINTPVIIADDYNTGTDGNFSACSLTINTGFNLTVNNGDYVEVENDVTVDGQLYVTSQGNFIQNNDLANFTDNSTNGVQVTKTKTFFRKFAYTYWSSPVIGETIEQTFGTVQSDRRFSFNATNFVDVLAEVGNTGVFNPGSDDIDDDGNDWEIASGVMQPGVGYAAIASQLGPAFPRLENFVFRGAFNNGVIQVPIINNSGGSYNDWNFIGNPYPCAIDADDFLTANSSLIGVLYFWDQATPESDTAGGSQGQNFSVDDYAMYNGTMGTGARGDTGAQPNGFIASGQGFFVEALTAGNITFNNAMRSITNDNSQLFKNTNSKSKVSNLYNKLWVNLTSDNGVFNQIGIGYVNGATSLNDGAFYDAKRIMSSGNAAILYSTIENNDDKFAIQGKAPNDLNENEIIDLGFKTSIDVATSYTLSIARLQGDFLNNSPVYLKDNLLNKTHNLSDSDYMFTSEAGEFNNRFKIVFTDKVLSTDDINLNDNNLSIVESGDDQVNFKISNSLSIKTVTIYDLLGRQLYNFKGTHSSSETYQLSNLKNTIYIAKVELSNGITITKKAIKK